MPICEMMARLAFTGARRPVSLPDGRIADIGAERLLELLAYRDSDIEAG